MEFPTNVPQFAKFKFVKVLSAPDDHPDWGETYMYLAYQNGEEKILFAKKQLHELINQYPPETDLAVTYKEEVNPETKKKYHKWDVKQAIFDETGKVPEQQPDLSKDLDARKKFREDRVQTMKECLQDALSIVEDYNAFLQQNNRGMSLEFNREDVRAIAISFMIDFTRKVG
jgi:hypothetical protein